jgi:hypothetical protein
MTGQAAAPLSEINTLITLMQVLLTVDQEVGGSSPPSCTSQASEIIYIIIFDRLSALAPLWRGSTGEAQQAVSGHRRDQKNETRNRQDFIHVHQQWLSRGSTDTPRSGRGGSQVQILPLRPSNNSDLAAPDHHSRKRQPPIRPPKRNLRPGKREPFNDYINA